MSTQKPMTRGIRLCRSLLVLAFSSFVCCMTHWAGTLGSDGERYIHWASAIVQNDIFSIYSEVVTPWGVPFSHWPSGLGVIFSLPSVALKLLPVYGHAPTFDNVNNGGLFVDWLSSVLMALSLWWVFYKISRNSRVMAYFGLTLSLVATPIGYYSITYASETLTLLCLSLGWLVILYPRRCGAQTAWIVGSLTGLFMMIRQNQALYFVPFLGAHMWRIVKQESTWTEKLRLLTALVLPISFALIQIGLSNQWMTGSFLRFPQQWGDAHISSMDFTSPEILAVLFHPWHGLLVYHPFYVPAGVAFVAVWIRGVWDRQAGLDPWTCLFLASGLTINLLFTAAFYTWWCGEFSLGSRGMAPWSVVLTPIFIHSISKCRGSSQSIVWVFSATACAIWSFLLLRLGESQFHTWSEFRVGIWGPSREWLTDDHGANLCAIGLLLILSVFLPCHLKLKERTSLVCGNVLLLLFVIYLQELLHMMVSAPLYISIAAGRAMTFFVAITIPILATTMVATPDGELRRDSPWPWRILTAVSVTAFALVAAVFTPFAIKAQCELASGKRAPRELFQYEATFHVVDCMLSCQEYDTVPGFEAKKLALREFIAEQVESTRIQPFR